MSGFDSLRRLWNAFWDGELTQTEGDGAMTTELKEAERLLREAQQAAEALAAAEPAAVAEAEAHRRKLEAAKKQLAELEKNVLTVRWRALVEEASKVRFEARAHDQRAIGLLMQATASRHEAVEMRRRERELLDKATVLARQVGEEHLIPSASGDGNLTNNTVISALTTAWCKPTPETYRRLAQELK